MATQWTAGLSDNTVLPASTLNTIGAAWETWTPRVDQNVTVASITNYARYCRIQKSVFATAYVTLNGAGTAGAAIAISLPLTAQSNSGQMIAYGWFYDANVTTFYNLTGYGLSSTTVAFISPNATGGSFGTNPAVTVAASDQMRIAFMYEAA